MDFNSILEKIKENKLAVAVGAGVLVVIVILIIVLVVGGDKKPVGGNNSQSGTQTETESETKSESEKVTENNTATETESKTEVSTETETVTESSTPSETGTETQTESTVPSESTNPGESTTPSESTNPSESTTPGEGGNDTPNTPVDTEDIVGEGDASKPYEAIPEIDGELMKVTTVEIAAGKSVFYNIARVGGGGMVLTINDANAYVVCDGVTYEANGGVVTVAVPIAIDSVSFEIGNKGANAASFTLVFANTLGNSDKPEKITTLDSRSISLAKGDEDGYYYSYKVTKSGTIRFYMTSDAADDGDLVIVRIKDGDIPVNRTFEADGSAGYIEMEVLEGETITIQAIGIPNRRGIYPAVTITWYGQYQ